MRIVNQLALIMAFVGGAFLIWGTFLAPEPQGFGSSPAPYDSSSFDVTNEGAPYDVSQPAIFHFPPPDEASFDEDFLAFRDRFKAAVDSRNLSRVLSMASKDVVVSFGGDAGHQALSALLNDPDAGEGYWFQLDDILSLPAASSSAGGYCVPYITCQDLPPEVGIIEPFETAFVIVPDASVYVAPDQSSEVVRTLSYDAVLLGSFLDDPDWAEIVVPGDGEGYILRKDFRMAVGFRAYFEEIDGAWKMSVFVAGD